MTHLIPLSLLLATIQMQFVPSESWDVPVSLALCINKQIIEVSCSDNKVQLKFWCEKIQNGELKLEFKTVSWNCGTSPCPPMTIDYGDGKTEKMCKECCYGNQRSIDHKNSDCKQRLQHTISTSISTVKITFEDSNCAVNVTKSTNNETASSLEFVGDSKSWIRAFQDCHQSDSSLLQITNQTVLNETINLLRVQTGLEKGVWVGLERSIFGTNLDWMWISGTKAVSPGWNRSFPVNQLNNHCGKLLWFNKTNEIKLLDANCHDELPYICQDP